MTKYRQILLRKENVPEAVCRQNKKKKIVVFTNFFLKIVAFVTQYGNLFRADTEIMVP